MKREYIKETVEYCLSSLFTPFYFFNYSVPNSLITASKLDYKIANEILEIYKMLERNRTDEGVSKLWAEQLEHSSFRALRKALGGGDCKKIVYLINNFYLFDSGRLGAVFIDKPNSYKDRLFQCQKVWSLYKKYKLRGLSFEYLATKSEVGNPFGFRIGNQRINFITIRHAYDSLELFDLVGNGKAFCEIGGGHGSLSTFILSLSKNSKYINVDILEMLIVCYYFLRKTLPSLKIKFIVNGQFDKKEKYDILLVPSFYKEILNTIGFDIAFNSYSFAEMPGKEAQDYANIVSKNKRCRYLIHENFYKNDSRRDLFPTAQLRFKTMKLIYNKPALAQGEVDHRRLLFQRQI